LKGEDIGRASAGAEQDIGPVAGYPRFYSAVALAQLTGWLPAERKFLIDISGPGARTAEVAAYAGHSVLRVIDPGMPAPPPVVAPEASGRMSTVTADGTGLSFLPDGCADGVIAEQRTLSLRLAAEELVTEIARVLRPGGKVFACVDSLTSGMAVLAEQHRWPHLVDVPNADVVLIPWPDGTITRCYGAEQLRELFTGGGLEVSWIRPRTVLSPQTVAYLLARDPASFGELVNAELHARSDDSVGSQLIACCVKRGGATPLHPPARESAAAPP
jgi:SAM-dependent methyltransferase